MSSKPQEEWSEDEQKLAKDYEKRVKELQEEREKYRKVRKLSSGREKSGKKQFEPRKTQDNLFLENLRQKF